MRAIRWTAWVAVAVVVTSGTVRGHHSIASVYDGGRRVTIEGSIAEFHFVSPHPFVTVDVKDASGESAPWRLEMDNRSELVEVGVTAQTLKPGDWVIVIGSPARSQPNTMYVQRLDRPGDGFRYEQVGSSPKIRRGSR
jgi:Family of unknown function (DUF6152)